MGHHDEPMRRQSKASGVSRQDQGLGSAERAVAASAVNQQLMARKMSNMEEERLPLRKRAAKVAKSKAWTTAVNYKKSTSCMLFTSVVTLVSCIFYVVGTYVSHKYSVVVVAVEAIFAAVFFVDYILSVTAEAVWLKYITSFEGVVDLLSIFPVFGAFYRWLYSLSFVRYLRLGKVTRVTRNHSLLDKIGSFNDVTVTATLLALKITGLVLMTTAIIYGTDNALKEDDDSDGAFSDAASDSGMQWHDALYFTIVTLSTVGYGDVLPVEAVSRMLMIVVILFALAYVPLEVGNLVGIIDSRPKNRDGYSRHLLGSKLHVVLAMVPGMEDGDDEAACFNPRSLRRIIDELCHEDHGMDNESLWVVVMAPCPPSREVLSVIRSPRYMSRVIYYRGSVMDPLDMKAVCAEYADCIFLYPHGGGLTAANASATTEEQTTLAARSVQRYLDRTTTDEGLMRRVSERSVMGVPCRTLVTVKELSSKDQLLRFGINHVICHDELKMSMLACATMFPAFLPFAINAMRSSSDYSIPVNNTGEVKDDRPVSAVPGKAAAAATAALSASTTSSRRENCDGGGGGDDSNEGSWQRDYKSGMEYEVYSLALHVSEKSSLLGLTFSRAAAKLYEDSEGEVLLLAVVEGLTGGVMENSRSGGRGGGGGGGSVGSSSGGSTENGGRRTPADVASARGGGSVREASRRGAEGGGDRGSAERERGSAAGFVHVTIFPEDDFTFSEKSNVLVLAEDKAKAERYMIRLQKSSASSTERRNRAQARELKGTDANSGSGGDDVYLGSSLRPVSEPDAAAVGAAAAAGGEAEEAEEEKVESDGVPPRTPLAGAGKAAAVAGAKEEGEEELEDGEASAARDGGDEAPRPPTPITLAKGTSLASVKHEDGQAEQMEAVRIEMRNEDGVRWEEALEALTEATGQLNSLKTRWGAFTEACITADPGEFFSKVHDARSRLDDALRVQAAAVPDGLRDHLVVIGAHPRLQYYVVAMRRQRPDVAIVVVTSDKEIFFELREKVAEAKCEDCGLNISKIFSVCGKSQDRATFKEARVADAAGVLLVSDEPNDSDTLLVSFELEQMLSEIPPGRHAPKVLIDLHTDNSIYYCGNTLGRGSSGSTALSRGGDSGRLKETSGLSAAGVWEWPLFAAGMIWTSSIMEVFAVQTYFSTEFLAFFETLLQIRRPVLVGDELVEKVEPPPPPPAAAAPEGFDTAGNAAAASSSSGGDGGGDVGEPPRREGTEGGAAAASASAAGAGAGAGAAAGAAASEAQSKAGGGGGRRRGDAGGGGRGASPSTVPPTGQFDMLRVTSRAFRRQRYDVLARGLILRGAMPLGLYRPAGTKGSSLCYTHLNPSVAERLVDGDVVFVLRSRSCSLVGSV